MFRSLTLLQRVTRHAHLIEIFQKHEGKRRRAYMRSGYTRWRRAALLLLYFLLQEACMHGQDCNCYVVYRCLTSLLIVRNEAICCFDYIFYRCSITVMLFRHPLHNTVSLSKPLERLHSRFLQQVPNCNSFIKLTLTERRRFHTAVQVFKVWKCLELRQPELVCHSYSSGTQGLAVGCTWVSCRSELELRVYEVYLVKIF